jgi:hypothetical protein
MKSAVALGALLCLGVCGCLHTYRVEQHSVVEAGLHSDGTSSCSSHADREERQWNGPWLGQPDKIRP